MAVYWEIAAHFTLYKYAIVNNNTHIKTFRNFLITAHLLCVLFRIILYFHAIFIVPDTQIESINKRKYKYERTYNSADFLLTISVFACC